MPPPDPIKRPPPRPFENTPAPERFQDSKEFRLFFRVAILSLFVILLWVVYFVKSTPTSKVVESVPQPKHELTAAEKTERDTLLLSKFEGALSDTHNGENFRQSPGYWKLLEVLGHYTPEEVHAHTTREITFDEAMADPDSLRGEFMRVRGIVGKSWANKLGRPILGQTDVWHSQLSEGEKTAFIFDMIDRPTGIDFEGEAVDVEGLFYRTVRYVAVLDEADVEREAPYLLVRNIHAVESQSATGMSAFIDRYALWLVGGIAFVIAAAALIMSRVQGRGRRRGARTPQPASFQEMFDKKMREEGRTPPPQT